MADMAVDMEVEVDISSSIISSMERPKVQVEVIIRAEEDISPLTIIREVEGEEDITRVEELEVEHITVIQHQSYIQAIHDRIRAANIARQLCLLLHYLRFCFS